MCIRADRHVAEIFAASIVYMSFVAARGFMQNAMRLLSSQYLDQFYHVCLLQPYSFSWTTVNSLSFLPNPLI
jgi:hypothetical protein